MSSIIETHYPNLFRSEDGDTLAHHLLDHSSVVLVGMKRVGISNFLRFFLNNQFIYEKYFKKSQLLFISIDAHDLIECAIFPFWTLVLKRMTDMIEQSVLSDQIKTKSRNFFLESIQLKDTFYTYDCVQKLCSQISQEGYYPVLVFARFDRLLPAFSHEFFANLQGLKDAAGKLSYIFTSYRPLEQLQPEIFTPSSMSVFAHTQYLKPATNQDSLVVLNSLLKRYSLAMDEKHKKALITAAAGHVQYLHLGLLAYKDSQNKEQFSFTVQELQKNESISLQSEELLDSLTDTEKNICSKIVQQQTLSPEDQEKSSYLQEAGILTQKHLIFSQLFNYYLEETLSHQNGKQKELSRQEQVLFDLFKDHLSQIIERHRIVETVWPDQAETGVSDWAIDRLVARLRQKLKDRQEHFKIITIVTRGYKLETL